MRVIHKQNINPAAATELELPEGATILDVQVQAGDRDDHHNHVYVWYMFDRRATLTLERRVLFVVGTGIEFEGDAIYIASFQLYGGDFVGHVFEVVGE